MEDNIEKIYRILAETDGVISGDRIGKLLGISRNAVNKHIKNLRAAGIDIISESKGYRLIEGDTFNAVALSAKLGGIIKVIFKECDSTNNYAKAMQAQIDGDYIIVAPQQSSGRGRLDRKFASRLGGAYMTLAYRPNTLTPVDSLNLVLLSGVAVSLTLEKYGIKPQIKWPNDVLVDGKKICGILLESTLNAEYLDRIFLGIGINMYNDISELGDIATSFEKLGIADIKREDVLRDLTMELLKLIGEFCQEGFNNLRKEYITRSCSIGKDVNIKTSNGIINGKAVGIADRGYLLVNNGGVITEVVAGDLMPDTAHN